MYSIHAEGNPMLVARTIRITSIAAVVALATVGSASAGTLRGNDNGLRYESDGAMTVRVWNEGRDLILVDTAATQFDRELPRTCAIEVVDAGVGARCVAPGQQELRITTGDGNSWITAWELPRRVSLHVKLGTGDNIVEGGSGDDRIDGGAGRDTLYGGPGDDRIDGNDGNDYLRGNGGNDDVRGGEGLNFLFGDGGDDLLVGGSSFEYFTGGRGDDVVRGGGGNDDIGLGAGDDVAHGGDGDDEIRGGAGQDTVHAGNGDDLVRLRDGEGDTVQCGGGNDIARVDAGEVDMARRSCEKVKQADAAIVDPVDQETATDDPLLPAAPLA